MRSQIVKFSGAWFFVALILSGFNAQAWDGPASAPGAGLAGLFRPETYIGGSFEQTGGAETITDSRFRANAVVSGGPPTMANELWQVNARYALLQVPSEISLPKSARKVPHELTNVQFGGTYDRNLPDGDNVGAILSVGSESDVAFQSIHEMVFQATGSYRVKSDELHSWIFLLNYSSNRSFAPNIPLPGVAYVAVYPEKRLVVSYGMPFFVSWKMTENLALRFIYFIPYNMNLDLTYGISRAVKVHAGFDWLSQAWLRANRETLADRIIFDRKHVDAGVKVSLGESYYMDTRAGLAFDQRFFEAQSILARDVAERYLPASAFVAVELARKF